VITDCLRVKSDKQAERTGVPSEIVSVKRAQGTSRFLHKDHASATHSV
jgi:hypothetical protein